MNLDAGIHPSLHSRSQSDQPDSAAKQIANGPVPRGAAVRFGQHAATEQVCDLLRVDFVILGLGAVDRFHVQRMSEYEMDPRVRARIAEPVPVEGALTGHGKIVAVRLDQFQEVLEVVVADVAVYQDVSFTVHDADVHTSSMQVDATVEFGLGLM